MAKPIGPICNLNCDYCYYKGKIELFNSSNKYDYLMSDDLLEEYIKQYIEAHPGPIISFGWQGGEPTLLGVGFFQKVIELQKKYLPKGIHCENLLQTNGTLLNSKWCHFLRENEFLVGISIDGPSEYHDKYRKNKEGKASFNKTLKGLKLLQENEVNFNVLCVLSDANIHYPLEVYNFFKSVGAKHIQFIPLVNSLRDVKRTAKSIDAKDYGNFLISIFNEWVIKDVGETFIQIFEEALFAWFGLEVSLCMFKKICGNSLVIEHNGDIYSCDHFVTKENKIGNIKKNHLKEIINSPKQKIFGQKKLETLPKMCMSCPVRFVCNGGCLKNRIVPTNEDGHYLNYLCSGYKQFFLYIDPFMKKMVELMKQKKSLNIIKDGMKLLMN